MQKEVAQPRTGLPEQRYDSAMLKHLFFLFLSTLACSTSLAARPITLTDQTIPYKTVATLQDIVCDAVLQLPSTIEQPVVKSSYINPKDLNLAEKTFTDGFLNIIEKWVEEAEKNTIPEATKHLGLLTRRAHTSENLAFVVQCNLKKDQQPTKPTASLTILGESLEKPINLQNLIKAAFTSQKKQSELVEDVLIIGALAVCAVTLGRRAYVDSDWYFFSTCAQRLKELSELLPEGVLRLKPEKWFSHQICFSTKTQEDKNRRYTNNGIINFELRKTRAEDVNPQDGKRHPTAYVLYDDKVTRATLPREMTNKLIYDINTPNDFTTALLTHLLVRKINVGPALSHFAEIIRSAPHRDDNVMTWLSSEAYTPSPRKRGRTSFFPERTYSLLEALEVYTQHKSLDNFFTPQIPVQAPPTDEIPTGSPLRRRAHSAGTLGTLDTSFTSPSERFNPHADEDDDGKHQDSGDDEDDD